MQTTATISTTTTTTNVIPLFVAKGATGREQGGTKNDSVQLSRAVLHRKLDVATAENAATHTGSTISYPLFRGSGQTNEPRESLVFFLPSLRALFEATSNSRSIKSSEGIRGLSKEGDIYRGEGTSCQ